MSNFKQIQVRRDVSSDWAAINPILALGEPGLETDTLKIKFGDGVTAWNSLPYLTQGVKGDKGDRGDPGVTGAAGHDGANGAQGDPGATGLPGSIGAQGATGATGAKGDKGDTGDKGLKGDTGNTGATGATGAIGAQGIQGIQGIKGDKGDQGDPGEGLPTGGTTGQQLVKLSNTDYDYDWETPAGAGDMLASVYDPTNQADDAFDQDNMADGTTNKNYTATEKTKLAGIETAADVTDSANVGAAGAFMKSVDDTDDITVGATNKFATAAEKTKLGHITVTQAVDLDAIETNANNVPGIKTKTDFITVTQAVDLDTMESDIAGKQPLDSDLTTIAALDSSVAGALVTDGSGWIKKTYAQLKTALSLVKADVGLGSVVNADTTTTANITDSSNKRFITDAQQTVLGNTSGTNSGNETTTTEGALINGATAKTTPVDADYVGLMDSAASNILKKLSWANVKATLKTYFDTLYQASGSYQPLDSDLTTIAGLTATSDNFMVAASSAWASRTPAQAKTSLALVKGDVGLGNVDNTSNATERAASAALTNKDLSSATNTFPTGMAVQQATTLSNAVATGSGAGSVIPNDNTIPQNTEGVEFMTVAITPKSATNILVIEGVIFLSNANATQILTAALFQDSVANALAVAVAFSGASTLVPFSIPFRHQMAAGTTSAITFKIRAGSHQSTTTTFNGVNSASVYGAITKSSITVREYKA